MSGGTVKQGRCSIRVSKLKNSVGSRATNHKTDLLFST